MKKKKREKIGCRENGYGVSSNCQLDTVGHPIFQPMIHEATTATRVTHPNVDTWTLHLLHSPLPQWTQSNPARWLSVGLAAPPAYSPGLP